ncbi:hypothetical protein [Pseudoxanthomonas mexicana]
MRSSMMLVVLGLVACTGVGNGQAGNEAEASAEPVAQEVSAVSEAVLEAPQASAAFAGQWEACEGTTSPDECSRYVLLQQGDRICGTWSYIATSDEFSGRVIARAASPTEARRTHICGRPGSETDTECEDGWQRIDKPLRLCDGKLSDRMRADGSCVAGYEAVPVADEVRGALQAQAWVQECLARDPDVAHTGAGS